MAWGPGRPCPWARPQPFGHLQVDSPYWARFPFNSSSPQAFTECRLCSRHSFLGTRGTAGNKTSKNARRIDLTVDWQTGRGGGEVPGPGWPTLRLTRGRSGPPTPHAGSRLQPARCLSHRGGCPRASSQPLPSRGVLGVHSAPGGPETRHLGAGPGLQSPPRARGLLPYLIQQPVSRDRDDGIPLAQAQPLDKLPGVVLSF